MVKLCSIEETIDCSLSLDWDEFQDVLCGNLENPHLAYSVLRIRHHDTLLSYLKTGMTDFLKKFVMYDFIPSRAHYLSKACFESISCIWDLWTRTGKTFNSCHLFFVIKWIINFYQGPLTRFSPWKF